MPLIPGKSKKTLQKNIRTEMEAHPGPEHRDQNLAIAFSVRRKSKKKASGGSVQSGSKDMNYADGGEIDPKFAEYTSHSDKDYESQQKGDAVGEGLDSIRHKHDTLEQARSAHARKYPEAAKHYAEALGHSKRAEEAYKKTKKMAGGGEVSAANEKRPMPEERDNDADTVSRNAAKKVLENADWTDNSTIKQSQKPSLTRLSRPKMVGSDVFSVRDRDDVERDLDRLSSEAPDGYKNQPRARYNEEGPDRQGSEVSDMQDEHSTHGKPYRKEIEDQYAEDEAESDMKMAKGGQIEPSDRESRNINMRTPMEPMDDEMSEHERREQNDHQDLDSPSEDEGHIYANALNEEGQDRQGPDKSDKEAPHNLSSRQHRDVVGNVDHEEELNPAHDKHSPDDSERQPEEEAEDEHYNSIAAAIMAKKEREASLMSDSDMDEMVRMYEGGEITRRSGRYNGEDSMDTHEDIDQVDLKRNAEEDANMEDQSSYDAMRKENYNESEGLEHMDSPEDSNRISDEEEMDSHDKHDMVSAIRSKMKSRRQFKRD